MVLLNKLLLKCLTINHQTYLILKKGINNQPCIKCQEHLSDLETCRNELMEKQNENKTLQQEVCESKTFLELLNNKLGIYTNINIFYINLLIDSYILKHCRHIKVI